MPILLFNCNLSVKIYRSIVFTHEEITPIFNICFGINLYDVVCSK